MQRRPAAPTPAGAGNGSTAGQGPSAHAAPAPTGRGCSIFFFEGHVGVSPTILNLSRMLAEEGSRVTIYGTRNPYPAPQSAGDGAHIMYLRRPTDFPGGSFVYRVLRRLKLGSAIPGLELITYTVQCLIAMVGTGAGRSSRKGPSIGVDTMGSIAALFRRAVTGRRYVYLSLELREVAKTRRLSGFVNWLDRAAYRKSEMVVIQDADRLATLNAYLRYKHPAVLYLPNSPRSSVGVSRPPAEQNFLRRRLSISAEEFPVIVLAAGMIDPEVLSLEIASAFVSVGHGAALVFHERKLLTGTEPYLNEVRESNRKNMFLSLDPVPLEDVDLVYASATIGLALYRGTQANHSQVSMASGKVGQYLKHGTPIIVSRTESLVRLVGEAGIGVVVDDPTDGAEFDRAIGTLLGDYERYSANARRYFEEEMDFDRKARPLLDALEAI
jgi:glycosyltransferase involved in cell wall biosynthesis